MQTESLGYFAELPGRWLGEVRQRVRPSTFRSYGVMLRLHVPLGCRVPGKHSSETRPRRTTRTVTHGVDCAEAPGSELRGLVNLHLTEYTNRVEQPDLGSGCLLDGREGNELSSRR
jgi:hypothetical protein